MLPPCIQVGGFFVIFYLLFTFPIHLFVILPLADDWRFHHNLSALRWHKSFAWVAAGHSVIGDGRNRVGL